MKHSLAYWFSAVAAGLLVASVCASCSKTHFTNTGYISGNGGR